MTLDNRHKLALPYWARPGFAAFAKKVDDEGEGGRDDEDQDDDEDDEDEDDDEGDGLEDLSEDELRAELAKTRKSLAGANGSSKARRLKIKRLTAELADARKAKPAGKKADDDEVDVEDIKATAKLEARAESDNRIRRVAARAELKAAGIPAEQVGKLIGMLDLDALDVDDDGEVDGLDEAIEELKTDWPQLFQSAPARRKRQSVRGGGDESATKKKLSPSERQAMAALGKKAS